MKLSSLAIVLTIGLQMLTASPGNGQELSEIKISLELKNEPLKQAFRKIEEQTDYRFAYNQNQIGEHKVTIEKATRTLEETINLLLQNLPLDYKVVNNKIVIFEPLKTGGIDNPDLSTEALAQVDRTITGKVTDKNGEGLPGASIIVKGTTFGTTTDLDGNFTLSVPDDAETLVVTFVGFEAQEISISSQSVINIQLSEGSTSLKEVIVSTGYWDTEKAFSTGNITKIDSKEIGNQPVTSPLLALQGRAAGVDLVPYSGAPGSAYKIEVRGRNSIVNGSLPLYVIDGVPVSSNPFNTGTNSFYQRGIDPLNALNPSDIESIEILKDAVATSIYGSRGANGVILITTKKGKSGKTRVDVSTYYGVGRVTGRINMMNSDQYIEMRNESEENDGTNPGSFDHDLNGNWENTPNTDWQEFLFNKSAGIRDINVGVSRGSNNSSYRLSVSHHTEESVLDPSNYGFGRSNVNFNFNQISPNDFLELNLGVNYGRSNSILFDQTNFIRTTLTLPPNAPALYDSLGNLNWQLFEFFGSSSASWTNPIAIKRQVHEVTTDNLMANGSIALRLSENLKFKSLLGYNSSLSVENFRLPLSSRAPTNINQSSTATSTFGDNIRKSWIIEPQFLYSTEFGNHFLTATIGMTWQESTSIYKSVVGSGYSSDIFLESLKGATSTTFNADDHSLYRYTALFAHIGHVWNEKYISDFTFRRDGSSRFGPGKRFGTFAALGVGWIFSNESFVTDNLDFLSFGKIRASYGTSGNDQIGDYSFLDTYSISDSQYQGSVSLIPTSLFNNNLAWEETKKLEIGLELGVFNDRIYLETSWYRNRSSNQLVSSPLPATTGFGSVNENLDAVVENSGIEILITSRNLDIERFKWTTSINLTSQRNKLVEFDNLENSSYATRYKVGESLNIQYLYKWTGIDTETGAHTFMDLNEDEVITPNDRMFMKPLDRDYYGGINNTFQYGSFEFSVLLQFAQQSSYMFTSAVPGRANTNQPSQFLERWQQEGDMAQNAAFTNSSTAFNRALNSDYAIENSSFIRLKSLSLVYSLPSSIFNTSVFEKASIFYQGQNLFTWTKYENLDPETGASLPPLTISSIGIQLNF